MAGCRGNMVAALRICLVLVSLNHLVPLVAGGNPLDDIWKDIQRELAGVSDLGKLEVTPRKDIDADKAFYYEVGQTVNISCTMDDQHVLPNSSLVLEHNSLPVPEGRLQAVNSTSLVLPVTPATVGDSGFYRCYRKTANDTTIVGKVTVQFGYVPEKPTMSCRAVNWERMECDWSAPPLPGQNPAVNLTQWTVRFGSSYIQRNVSQSEVVCTPPAAFPCTCLPSQNSRTTTWVIPAESSSNLTCSFGGELFGEYQVYRFSVSGRNKVATGHWNFSVVANESIVEFLLPLQDLTMVPVNSTEMRVTWSVPPEAVPEITKPRYDLTYWSRDLPSGVMRQTVGPSPRGRESVLLSGLRPASPYSLELRWRLGQSRYWSPPSPASARTLEDVPWAAPRTTPGAYTRCQEPQSCVRVYWKPMERIMQNGQILNYSLTTSRCQGDEQDARSRVVTDGVSYSALLGNLQPSLCHDVSIRAATRVGYSKMAAHVEVVEPDEGLEAPEAVYLEARDNGSYHVSWTFRSPGIPAEPRNVTVFWCLGVSDSSTQVVCKSPINWTYTTSEEVTVTPEHVTPASTDPSTRWRFGVTWVKDGRGAGITWDRCLYVDSGEVVSPPISVEQTADTEVRVQLAFSDCDPSVVQGRPLAYQVLYSSLQAHEHYACQKGLTVNRSAEMGVSGVSVGGLERRGRYGFCLRVVTAARTTDYSNPAILQLSAPDQSSWIAVGISVPVVAVVIAIVAYCWRKIRHRKKFDIDTSFMVTGENFGITNIVFQELREDFEVPPTPRDRTESGIKGQSAEFNHTEGSSRWTRDVGTPLGSERLSPRLDNGGNESRALVLESCSKPGEHLHGIPNVAVTGMETYVTAYTDVMLRRDVTTLVAPPPGERTVSHNGQVPETDTNPPPRGGETFVAQGLDVEGERDLGRELQVGENPNPHDHRLLSPVDYIRQYQWEFPAVVPGHPDVSVSAWRSHSENGDCSSSGLWVNTAASVEGLVGGLPSLDKELPEICQETNNETVSAVYHADAAHGCLRDISTSEGVHSSQPDELNGSTRCGEKRGFEVCKSPRAVRASSGQSGGTVQVLAGGTAGLNRSQSSTLSSVSGSGQSLDSGYVKQCPSAVVRAPQGDVQPRPFSLGLPASEGSLRSSATGRNSFELSQLSNHSSECDEESKPLSLAAQSGQGTITASEVLPGNECVTSLASVIPRAPGTYVRAFTAARSDYQTLRIRQGDGVDNEMTSTTGDATRTSDEGRLDDVSSDVLTANRDVMEDSATVTAEEGTARPVESATVESVSIRLMSTSPVGSGYVLSI